MKKPKRDARAQPISLERLHRPSDRRRRRKRRSAPEVPHGVAQPPDRRGLVLPADVGPGDLDDPQPAARRPHHELGVPEPPPVLDLVEEREHGRAAEELEAGLGVAEGDAEQVADEERVAAAHEVPVEREQLEGVDAPNRGHVGALLDRPNERRDVPAVHLEVHVEVAGDLAPRGAEAVGDGGSASAVRVVEDHAEVEVPVGGHDLLQDRARAVAARVVDEDDLERPARLLERLADLGEAREEVLGLVVAGEHEAQVRAAPAHARDPVSRTAATTRSTSPAASRGCSGRRRRVAATRSVTGITTSTPSLRAWGAECRGT